MRPDSMLEIDHQRQRSFSIIADNLQQYLASLHEILRIKGAFSFKSWIIVEKHLRSVCSQLPLER